MQQQAIDEEVRQRKREWFPVRSPPPLVLIAQWRDMFARARNFRRQSEFSRWRLHEENTSPPPRRTS